MDQDMQAIIQALGQQQASGGYNPLNSLQMLNQPYNDPNMQMGQQQGKPFPGMDTIMQSYPPGMGGMLGNPPPGALPPSGSGGPGAPTGNPMDPSRPSSSPMMNAQNFNA